MTNCDSFNRVGTPTEASGHFTPNFSLKEELEKRGSGNRFQDPGLSNFTPNRKLSLYSLPDSITCASKNSIPWSNRKEKKKSKFSNKERNKLTSSSASQNKVWDELQRKSIRQGNLLLMAAEKGKIQRVKDLLDPETQGKFLPNVNIQGLDRYTPLHFAVNEKHLDVANFLLEKGANVNAETNALRTPLHIACENGHVEMIELLIESGADVNGQDNNGNTPGHILAQGGFCEAILAYSKAKPDFTIKNKYTETLIESSTNLTTRNLMIQLSGVNENRKTAYGRTIVSDMVLHNSRADVVKSLLFKIQNIGQVNCNRGYIIKQGLSNRHSSRLRRKKIIEAAKRISSINLKSVMIREINKKREVGLRDFDIVNLLGEGTFGKVFLVRYKPTSKLYAMKVLNKEKFLQKKLMHYAEAERNILCNARHPFIVSLDFAFQTAEKLFLVLKYYSE